MNHKGVNYKRVNHKGVIHNGVNHKGVNHKGGNHKRVNHKGGNRKRVRAVLRLVHMLQRARAPTCTLFEVYRAFNVASPCTQADVCTETAPGETVPAV